MKKVEILKKMRVFDGFFKLDEAVLCYERFDGAMSPAVRRLAFERGDSAAAILYDPERDRVILIDQFKYPTYGNGDGWLVEVVAGAIDPGEVPDAAVAREIAEETGYVPTKLAPISTFYVSPGGSSERIFLYYAEVNSESRASAGGGVASEHEDIETREFAPAELFDMLDKGEIADAKTIIAIQWLRRVMEDA